MASNDGALPTVNNTGLFNQESEQAVITDYRIQHRYARCLNKYMLGIASPQGFRGQSAAFVQLAAPTLLWVADWTGCRFLTQPMIPDPNAVSSDWEVLDLWIEPFMMACSPDGNTPLYRVSGTYVYGNRSPGPNVYDNVAYPLAPWITGPNLIRSINASNLARNLTQPSTGITGVGNRRR